MIEINYCSSACRIRQDYKRVQCHITLTLSSFVIQKSAIAFNIIALCNFMCALLHKLPFPSVRHICSSTIHTQLCCTLHHAMVIVCIVEIKYLVMVK